MGKIKEKLEKIACGTGLIGAGLILTDMSIKSGIGAYSGFISSSKDPAEALGYAVLSAVAGAFAVIGYIGGVKVFNSKNLGEF